MRAVRVSITPKDTFYHEEPVGRFRPLVTGNRLNTRTARYKYKTPVHKSKTVPHRKRARAQGVKKCEKDHAAAEAKYSGNAHMRAKVAAFPRYITFGRIPRFR